MGSTRGWTLAVLVAMFAACGAPAPTGRTCQQLGYVCGADGNGVACGVCGASQTCYEGTCFGNSQPCPQGCVAGYFCNGVTCVPVQSGPN